MTIWMVTGLHDPRWLPNILANFERQTYVDKRLIIVENGAGIGAVPRRVPAPGVVVVLQSETGAAQPLNVALRWLRELDTGDDWFAKCDADDYYGPGYLESLPSALEAGIDYAGRSSLYIRTTGNRLWFARGNGSDGLLHGPTLCARVGAALDFPIVADWGEDYAWCHAMRAAGKRALVLPPEHFCYQRHANHQHTWPCSDDEIRSSWNTEFFDLGEFDADIVDAVKPRPAGTSLGRQTLTVDNCMPLRVLREKVSMKTIKFTNEPAKVDGVEIVVEGKPADFRWFVGWLLDSDQRFNSDGIGIRASMAIEKTLGEATDELVIDDAHHQRLKEAAENPTAGVYPLRRGRLCLPWVEAIASAK